MPRLRLIDQADDVVLKQEKEEIQDAQSPSDAPAPPANPREAEIAGPSGKKPKALTQTEEDIWDTFLDDEPFAPTDKMDREQMIDIDTRLAVIPPHPLDPNQYVSNIIRPPVELVTEKVQEDQDVPDQPIQQQEIDKEKKAPGFQIAKFTPVEVVASLLFLALLLIGAIITVGVFRSHLKGHADPYATPDFPVKGNIATVAKAETFWRAPVLDGPNPDTTKLDVILLPVITITLNDCKAPQGALRVMFLNHNNEIVGDTVTKSYSNNRFNATQSSTLSFASTAGFTEFGEQEAYRAKISKPWTIQVFEGPSESASSNSFKLLFSTPIVATRH